MAFVCVIRYFSHNETVIVPSHDTWSKANKSRLKLKLSARCGTHTALFRQLNLNPRDYECNRIIHQFLVATFLPETVSNKLHFGG
jgi:hypothetical protein